MLQALPHMSCLSHSVIDVGVQAMSKHATEYVSKHVVLSNNFV